MERSARGTLVPQATRDRQRHGPHGPVSWAKKAAFRDRGRRIVRNGCRSSLGLADGASPQPSRRNPTLQAAERVGHAMAQVRLNCGRKIREARSPLTVRPEPVEGLLFFFERLRVTHEEQNSGWPMAACGSTSSARTGLGKVCDSWLYSKLPCDPFWWLARVSTRDAFFTGLISGGRCGRLP